MFIESHFSAQSHENAAFEVTFVVASLLFSKEFCIRVRASNNRPYRSKITYYQHMKWNCQKCWYQKEVASVLFPAAGGALKRRWCAAPSLQAHRHRSTSTTEIRRIWSTPTFVFLFSCSNFLYLFGWFHEERKDSSQAQNVNELVAVISALWSNHGMVQHLQGTAAGDLLLSEKRQVELFRDIGALDHTMLKRQHGKGNGYDKGSTKSLSTSSTKDFLQAKPLYWQIFFSELRLGIFSWVFLF